MYAAGRPMTMAEVNLWLSTMSEYATPALLPSCIALPPTHPSGRAKFQNLNRPPTPNATQSMMERSIMASDPSPTYFLTISAFPMMTTIEIQVLEGVQIPEDPPSKPIPPKLLHLMQLHMATTGNGCKH